ncbi:CHASE2 domain-containing protein [Pannonibacter carbonis]|uniref:CHASE2 domain-containing protein n=1 Tax=Pannonibacter carbonis TaxID=2067569 RepID=UPI0018E54375|nr:adenylate/guanylate cyclase domain-containing protein [Pannonibacter carbonis]
MAGSAKPLLRPQDRNRQTGVIVVALLSVLAAAMIAQSSAWRLLDARLFDYLSTLQPPQQPDTSIVIVAIDEPSFAEIGQRWPWPRDLHAALVTSLRKAGARVIGLDIIMAEPSDPDADAALAATMGPDVVLAADETLIETPQATSLVRVEPLPELLQNGARIGLSSVVLDGDGTLRRIPPYDDSFARQLLAAAGTPQPSLQPGLMQVFGPARTYPTISYYQALDPARFLPEGFLAGKTVLVGLSMQSAPTVDAGGADAYSTSWTPATGRLVPGVEIQATLADNLAHGLTIRPATPATGLILCAVAGLLAAALVWHGTSWRTLIAGTASLAFGGIAAYFALRFGRVSVSPLAPSLVILSTGLIQFTRDFIAERRLRQEVTRAFSRYLSPVLVERLARDPAQLRLGGERRMITVLFSDVRGFTSIAETMQDEPERLTLLINRILDPLTQIILARGGTIDKYMGDAVMAFWNAPLDDPDHVANAVTAGLEMVAAIARLNTELAAETGAGSDPLEIRIGVGIETGMCFVGNFGSSHRYDYSVLGDTVNLASRLEGLTKSYDVPLLIGPQAAARLPEGLDALDIDLAEVKGKSQRVPVATVVRNEDPAILAAHSRLMRALFAGLRDDVEREAASLSDARPALSGFYDTLPGRLTPEGRDPD